VEWRGDAVIIGASRDAGGAGGETRGTGLALMAYGPFVESGNAAQAGGARTRSHP
jgi:hypothetical protein